MKSIIKISDNVIRRLPRYLRKLDELSAAGVNRISSAELGKELGLTPSQIRQDFSNFGEFGQQGYGYNVTALHDNIADVLGMNQGFHAILIGVGKMGRAMAENFDFKACGITLDAAFETKPALIGTEVNGTPIRDSKEVYDYLAENQGVIAVLCVPKTAAKSVAADLIAHGVDSIWNFTNVDLVEPDSTVLTENLHFSDSFLSLSYFIARRQQEQAEKAEAAAKKM